MKIDIPKFETENGDPAVSLSNVVKAIQYYGSPVGVIQAILPDGVQASHVFFFDGWVHLALGLGIGFDNSDENIDSQDPNHLLRVLALQQVLNLVPGWAQQEQYLFDTGLDVKYNGKPVKFILCPEGNNLLELIAKCPGTTALNNCISIETANGAVYQ
jgi:hypothetical protein